MPKKLRPYIKDLYWFPKSYLSMARVKKHFTMVMHEDMDAGTEEVLLVYRTKHRNGVTWIGLPRGQTDLIKECLLHKKTWKRLEDRRTDNPVKFRLRFNGEYRKYQPKASAKLAAAEQGVLKSGARTGKCLSADTLVATSLGILRIGETPRGNLLKKENGEEWYAPRQSSLRVLSEHGYRRVRAIYRSRAELFRITTDTGYTVEATANERVWVEARGGWVFVSDLVNGQDALTVQSRTFWRGNDMLFGRMPEEYVKLFGTTALIPSLATLVAYRARMTVLDQRVDGVTVVEFQASPSCQKYAGILFGNYGVHPGLRAHTYEVPQWLWHLLDTYYHETCLPRVVLTSRRNIVKTYLRALFESTGFNRGRPVKGGVDLSDHNVHRLEWNTKEEQLAREIQVVMANFGVWLTREGSVLRADPANSREFYSQLDVRGVPNLIDGDIPARPPVTTVISVESIGQQEVWDYSVGAENAPDEHNFVANALKVHNTIMGTAAVLEVGQKTLILAHQTDLIEQFCNETINDPEGILFNGASLKVPEAAICKRLEDFEEYPICLATYQTFLSKGGRRLLKKIKDLFGVVMIDEVHRAPADGYSSVVTRFSARHMWGLTATDDRKDGKYQLAKLIIGDLVHSVKAKVMSAKVYGHKTHLKHSRPPTTWNGAISFLFKSEKRNDMIVRHALRDVAKGHTVLIPIMHVAHGIQLKKMIMAETGDNDMVFLFNGSIAKNKRQWARDQMNNNKKIKIVIAMRSMLTGMNIPRWSAIYTVAPISNVPNYEQEIKRVCTPMEGKLRPIVRFFFDDVLGLSYGCLLTCHKTLASVDNGFELSPSYLRLLAGGKARSNNDVSSDDLQIVKSVHQREGGKKMRF